MRNSTPVFMYHKVGAPGITPSDSFLNVSAVRFARQMQLLHRLDYRTRSFRELAEALSRGQSLPRRSCVITFDDAYQCVADHALPAMAPSGFTGVLFVVSSEIGGENGWDREMGHPVLPLMGHAALAEASARGWEIAGHTRTHPRLNAITPDEALAEIDGGCADLERLLGARPDTFCYPFGGYNSGTPNLVRQTGLIGACTTRSGVSRPGTDPFLVPRVKVGSRDGNAGFLYRLIVRPYLPNLRPRR